MIASGSWDMSCFQVSCFCESPLVLLESRHGYLSTVLGMFNEVLFKKLSCTGCFSVNISAKLNPWLKIIRDKSFQHSMKSAKS
jgi:hypothetical protein